MNRKQLEESRAYAKPAIVVCGMQTESLLQSLSGQHHPGHHGSGPSSAKQGWFDDEEEDDLTPNSSSNDEGNYQLWEE